ncbi:MAG: hypothetical protein VX737_05610 [Pseudomonadota bacterium]|nr:hypothetical protein [Pseudomonadota bacterium]
MRYLLFAFYVISPNISLHALVIHQITLAYPNPYTTALPPFIHVNVLQSDLPFFSHTPDLFAPNILSIPHPSMPFTVLNINPFLLLLIKTI